MSRSFSIAMRRSVAVLQQVFALCNHYSQSLDGPAPSKSYGACQRLLRYRAEIMMHVAGVRDVSEMSASRKKQVRTIAYAMGRVIDRWFPADEIDGDVFINNVLALVEDVRADIPAKNKRLTEKWSRLTDTLVTLYRHRDPDLESPAQEMGARLAGDLMKAIEGRLPVNYGKPSARVREIKQKPQLKIVRRAS